MENAREVAEEKYSQSKVARRILNLLRVCAPGLCIPNRSYGLCL